MIAIEELIGTLYDMIQDARNMPLSSDKCVVDRDKALDILDEIRENMPVEFRKAKEIVSERDIYMQVGKKEVDSMRKQAEDYAAKLIREERVIAEATKQANDIIKNADAKSAELKKAASGFCDAKLNETEALIAASLEEIRKIRVHIKNLK